MEQTSLDVEITASKNGPYLVEGRIVVISEDGSRQVKQGTVALCRCGGSSMKPYCDGTHKLIGFKS